METRVLFEQKEETGRPNTTQDRHAVVDGWLNAAINRLQVGIGEPIGVDPHGVYMSLGRAVEQIAAPTTPLERLLLRGVLFEYACRVGACLHQNVHQRAAVLCAVNEIRLVEECFGPMTADPRAALANWASRFSMMLRAAHPETTMQAVARRIAENPNGRLQPARLAAEFGLTASTLRRAFRRERGQSMREYHSLVRLVAILEAVRTEKVIAMAKRFGFESTKSFYRLFARLTGMTPTEFRNLPPGEAHLLIDKARVKIHHANKVPRAKP